MGCGQRKLAPSVMSVTNDKDDNKMIPGAVHRSLCISLMAEENHGKLQLEDRLMKGLIASNGVPFLQMRSVGSHSTSGREK